MTPNPKHEAVLASPDAKPAANKRLVDFWRAVFEGGHLFRIEDGKIAEHWDPAQKQ